MNDVRSYVLGALVACTTSSSLEGSVVEIRAKHDCQRTPRTLEDIYGDTGDSFQGSIGVVNFEGELVNPAQQSYGIGIDDMYVEWREFTLDPDQTSCASGSCAVLELPTTNLFQGDTVLEVSLLDRTPYGSACLGGTHDGRVCTASSPSCAGGSCVPAYNDCDLDGGFDGPNDDEDCNDNAIPDLVARATSEGDVAGVILVLDRQGPGSPEYRATLSLSLGVKSPNTLLVAQQGADAPTITVSYLDIEDGTGHMCQNSVIPAEQGLVRAATTVFIPTCDLALASTVFSDNGDGDVFADTDETLALSFAVRNNCGFDLTGCSARLSTNSPWIECIQTPVVSLGTVPSSPQGTPHAAPHPFRFKVSPAADRGALGLGPDDALKALFRVSFTCNEIDANSSPQEVGIELDLTLDDGGQTPVAWKEDFESGSFGKFVPQNNDAALPGINNLEGLFNANGWRCQYSNPDWVLAGAYGDDSALDCYPGLNLAHANSVFWRVDGSTAPHTGPKRAYRGVRSVYYGVWLTNPAGEFTTPMGVVEGLGTTQPINLGVDDPHLSFWHQISLVDHRSIGPLAPRRSADRGVVQIQLADASGSPDSVWLKLEPIQNAYDEQAADNFFNCTFDPIDDGSTEDDFFDPTDPHREYGPSSTCFPEFTFGYMGDTRDPFDFWVLPGGIGNATTPPAQSDAPSLGPGVWVKSVVDLSEFRGKRARLRFLVSALKAPAENWQLLFSTMNPGAEDDGWWLDDVIVDEALVNPAEIANDNFSLGSCSASGTACIGQCRSSFEPCSAQQPCGVGEGDCVAPCPAGQSCSGPPPSCGATCTRVEANVVAATTTQTLVNPTVIDTAAPGQVVSFDAADPGIPSWADACVSGTLQYRFCASRDPDGGGPAIPDADCTDRDDGFPGDVILRDWTEHPLSTVAPQASYVHVTEVRCSTLPACLGTRRIEVNVLCPGGVNALGLADVRAVNETTLVWSGAPLDVDWLRGSFVEPSDVGDYVEDFMAFASDATSIPMIGSPPPGGGWYYLVKADGPLNTIPLGYYCNSRTWRSGGPSEQPEPARDAAFQ